VQQTGAQTAAAATAASAGEFSDSPEVKRPAEAKSEAQQQIARTMPRREGRVARRMGQTGLLLLGMFLLSGRATTKNRTRKLWCRRFFVMQRIAQRGKRHHIL